MNGVINMIELFYDEKNCCGCEACLNICPTNAIQIANNKIGFSYPVINYELCIACGKCNHVCAFQKDKDTGNEPIFTYAAINKNKTLLSRSSSGGVFAALSEVIINKNGIIYGCAYDEYFLPKHINITDIKDLYKIQGSKYVQSSIGLIYRDIKKNLDNDRWILFTGTPCQVAGLKSFLGKDYDKLICTDVICHGVPSYEFFKDYIKFLEDKYKGKIYKINFRDKYKGWGLLCKIEFIKNGKKLKKYIILDKSYYYRYFLEGHIHRESCYQCKYACSFREGDFTMGDYWGVQKFHNEINTSLGASVLMVNTQKGLELLKELDEYLVLIKSDLKYAKIENHQLIHPTPYSDKRDEIFKTWKDNGSSYIAHKYYRENFIKILKSTIKFYTPKPMKKMILKVLKK